MIISLFIYSFFVVLGIQPRVSLVLDKVSTIKLFPLLLFIIFKNDFITLSYPEFPSAFST
jgi:hypothetical protein